MKQTENKNISTEEEIKTFEEEREKRETLTKKELHKEHSTTGKYKIMLLVVLGIFAVSGLIRLMDNFGTAKWTQTVALTDNGRYRTGADSNGSQINSFNFCEQGFFRLDNGVMNFYELRRNKTFTMCEEPRCKHEGANCMAYFDVKRPVKGLGSVDGKVYAAFWNDDLQLYQLCTMNLNNTNRQVIADLPINCYPDEEAPNWFEANFRIAYTPGKAWISVEDGSKEVVVDLGNGTFIDISTAELVMGAEEQKIRAIAHLDTGIVFDLQNYAAAEPSDEYYFYDFSKEEFTLLDSISAIAADDEGGCASLLEAIGEFEDGFICFEQLAYDSADPGRTVYYWNVTENTRQELFTIEDGDIPARSTHNIYDGRINNDNQIYYCEYEYENGARTLAHHYSYYLLPAITKELYTDKWDLPYRLEGESGNEWLYGYGGNGMDSLTRIKRTSYEQGDFYYRPEMMH